MQTYDAVVVGAGYIGCAVAHALTAAGLRTVLLDQGQVMGGASRANFGNIQVQDAELAHSLPMVTAGFRRFADLEQELDCSVGYRRQGSLLLIETESQWQVMAARLPALHAAGIAAELVPAARLPELEPLLDPHVALGACYYPNEAQVSPFGLMWAYLRQARKRGLTVCADTRITGFDIGGGRVRGVRTQGEPFSAGAVVLATGAWTPALGRLLGREWAIPHVHGQALVTEACELRLNAHVSSAAFFEEAQVGPGQGGPEAALAVGQSREGHFLLGEAAQVTEDLGRHASREGGSAIARLISRCLPMLQCLRVLRAWAAPVAFTEDGLPFLGPVAGLPGLILATAFKSTVIVTPLIGDTVAQLLVSGRSDLDLTPFSPDRPANVGHDKTIPPSTSMACPVM
jgi:sarcosine oxidase subunit beta